MITELRSVEDPDHFNVVGSFIARLLKCGDTVHISFDSAGAQFTILLTPFRTSPHEHLGVEIVVFFQHNHVELVVKLFGNHKSYQFIIVVKPKMRSSSIIARKTTFEIEQ